MVNKNNILVAVIMVFIISVLAPNMASSNMHHMDQSDCAMQVSCGNCIIFETIKPPIAKIIPSLSSKLVITESLFESCKLVPSSPPPKN
jgi:hypothetical protein